MEQKRVQVAFTMTRIRQKSPRIRKQTRKCDNNLKIFSGEVLRRNLAVIQTLLSLMYHAKYSLQRPELHQQERCHLLQEFDLQLVFLKANY